MGALLLALALFQPVGQVSVLNGTGYPRNERVKFAIPAAPGVLQPTTGITIGGVPSPYRAVSRWPDGSVKWASATRLVSLDPYEEETHDVEFVGTNPTGFPALPFLTPAVLTVTVNGTAFYAGSWSILDATPDRICFLSTTTVGPTNAALRIQIFAEVLAGQNFGKLTFVIGNDALVRNNAAPIAISTLKLRIDGGVMVPLYGYAHQVVPVTPLVEYSFPLGTLGDGQRWATRFAWAGIGSDFVSFALSAIYPLYGLPDPVWVSQSGAAGLYGTLKDPAGATLASRIAAEGAAQTWLATPRPDPWDNLGFLMKDEGSSGPHGGWGKLALIDLYRTRAPSLLRKFDCLAITQASHRNDHYYPFRFEDYPGVSTLGGWVSPPLRPQGAYATHITGNHGWIGRDEAHSEAGIIHEVVELTGDEYLAHEMWQMGEFWAAYEGPGSGGGAFFGTFGEGRAVSRPLENALRAFLVGPEGFRQDLLDRIDLWIIAKLVPGRGVVPVPGGPPKRAFSIYSGPKWLTWCPQFQPAFPGYCPPSGIAYPYSEAMVPSVFVRMAELLGTSPAYEGVLEDMERLFVGISVLGGYRTVESNDGQDLVAGGPIVGVWGYASFRGLARRAEDNGDIVSFLILDYVADLIESNAAGDPASQVWLQY
jgi:hypothetical protein